MCDALIEITTKSDVLKDKYCYECNGQINLLSVADATIYPTTTKEVQMETTTDTNFLTREFLESQFVVSKSRITQLEERIKDLTQRSVSLDIELNRMRNEIQEYTIEELDLGGLSESQADSIASICGFELTKEFQLEVEVQYSITVNARNEEEALNLMYDIDFDSVSEPEGVAYLSASVDRVEVA